MKTALHFFRAADKIKQVLEVMIVLFHVLISQIPFMKHLHSLLFLLLGCTMVAHAQKYTISGYIRDAGSGEPLISANVYDSRSGSGACKREASAQKHCLDRLKRYAGQSHAPLVSLMKG